MVTDPPSIRPLAIPLDHGTTIRTRIQALIPLGLRAVEQTRAEEGLALAGARDARVDAHPDAVRWGVQPGSIFLAEQTPPIQMPRVRDRVADREIPLTTYQQIQTPRALGVGRFRRVPGGRSCRKGEAAAVTVPAAIGLATSNVSRRFLRASARACHASWNGGSTTRVARGAWRHDTARPLVVHDAAKDLRAAVHDVFGRDVAVQRCQ